MYLDFKEISAKVNFVVLLNFLNIPYKETKKEVKTDKIIVNKAKNLFCYKQEPSQGGGVINFYSDYADCNLRESAQYLFKTFIQSHQPKRKIPVLKLKYHKILKEKGFSEDFCQEYEVGKPEGKTIMAGKIAFRVIDHNNKHKGYIGYDIKKQNWFYPKGFKRDTLYGINRRTGDYCIVVSGCFDVLHLINIGHPYCVALMAKSMTEAQEELLTKYFKRIILLHPEPENIVNRLSQKCFVKALKTNSVEGLGDSDVKKLF